MLFGRREARVPRHYRRNSNEASPQTTTRSRFTLTRLHSVKDYENTSNHGFVLKKTPENHSLSSVCSLHVLLKRLFSACENKCNSLQWAAQMCVELWSSRQCSYGQFVLFIYSPMHLYFHWVRQHSNSYKIMVEAQVKTNWMCAGSDEDKDENRSENKLNFLIVIV